MLHFFGFKCVREFAEFDSATGYFCFRPGFEISQVKYGIVFHIIQFEEILHFFGHALLIECESDRDMFLEIALLLGFFDSEFSEVFPEFDNRIENDRSRESRVSKEKSSFLVVEEFLPVEEREREVERASGEFGQILSGHHTAESTIGIGHLYVELFRDRVPESVGSDLREAFSARRYDEILPFHDTSVISVDTEDAVRFFYLRDIEPRPDFRSVFGRFAHEEVEEILGFPTLEYDSSAVLHAGADPVFFNPIDHIVVRKLREEAMNRLDVFSEVIVLGRYIDIGHIATLSARKYDFLSEGAILFEDDFPEVFGSENGAEKSGSTSTDNDYIVHTKRFYECISTEYTDIREITNISIFSKKDIFLDFSKNRIQ